MSLTLPCEVTRIELAENYPALQIKTSACEATLALHGAHLTHWQPVGCEHPVLYNSPTAIYREGKAIRGGIPLCWPWFNAHPTSPESHPSHGVARNRFWELERAEMKGEDLHLSLSLPNSAEVRSHVPFAHEVRAHFILGKSCRVELETVNKSARNVSVGGALHTYLCVSTVAQTSLQGLGNTPYLDTTTSPEGACVQEEESLRIAGEVDRIYIGTANEVQLSDEGYRRQVTVAKEGSLTTVVWNPWMEKAAALGDLPDEAYRDFVCIEATNARHDARIVAPGATHVLATEIRVSEG